MAAMVDIFLSFLVSNYGFERGTVLITLPLWAYVLLVLSSTAIIIMYHRLRSAMRQQIAEAIPNPT